MARTPTRLTASSGQGVSRKSYQTARSMGQRGTGSPFTGLGTISGTKDYSKAKTGYKPPKDGKMNIDYGDTLPISNLDDLKAAGRKKRK